jgi:hypothetical protein
MIYQHDYTNNKKKFSLNNKKINEQIKLNIIVPLEYLNPYMPKFVNVNYYKKLTISLPYLQYNTINILKNNNKLVNIESDYKNMKIFSTDTNISICNYDNNQSIINDEINNNKTELKRIDNIYQIFINCVNNYEFKNAHLYNKHEYNNVINGIKERTSYIDIFYKTQKKFTNNTKNELTNSLFKYNFNKINSKYTHEPRTKFVLNHLFNLFNCYLKSIKYNIDVLTLEPNTIDFDNKDLYLTPINITYFQYVEKQYIKIKLQNTLKFSYYIDCYDKIEHECEYIKLSYMKNSTRIDIIFE